MTRSGIACITTATTTSSIANKVTIELPLAPLDTKISNSESLIIAIVNIFCSYAARLTMIYLDLWVFCVS